MTAFSNSTEWESWSSRWCDRCKVDEPAREREDFANGCPLILEALSGGQPLEWFEQPSDSGDRYHCVNFRGVDEPDDDPQHPEDPIPGQGELVSRDQFVQPKVFVDVANEIRGVTA